MKPYFTTEAFLLALKPEITTTLNLVFVGLGVVIALITLVIAAVALGVALARSTHEMCLLVHCGSERRSERFIMAT